MSSRAGLDDIIRAIDGAAAEQSSPTSTARDKLLRIRGDAHAQRNQSETALASGVSLKKDLYDTCNQLATLTGANVVPLQVRVAAAAKAARHG